MTEDVFRLRFRCECEPNNVSAKDSREHSYYRRRRYECGTCQKRWTTYEFNVGDNPNGVSCEASVIAALNLESSSIKRDLLLAICNSLYPPDTTP